LLPPNEQASPSTVHMIWTTNEWCYQYWKLKGGLLNLHFLN